MYKASAGVLLPQSLIRHKGEEATVWMKPLAVVPHRRGQRQFSDAQVLSGAPGTPSLPSKSEPPDIRSAKTAL